MKKDHMFPSNLLPLHTRIRSCKNRQLVGVVAGYGTIQAPWAPGVTAPVYLVALDASIPLDEPHMENHDVVSLSVVCLHVDWVEREVEG
jgi:hypothetical protein